MNDLRPASVRTEALSYSSSTAGMMTDVIIALLPLLLWACYVFGLRALTVCALSVLSCVLFELLFTLITRKKITVLDLSAVVTGLLLAYNLPHTVPFWIPILGAFISIVPTKMLFGGLGKNLLNPAAFGKTLLLGCFFTVVCVPSAITRLGLFDPLPVGEPLGPSPLSALLTPPADGISALNLNSLFDSFIGYERGNIGDVSSLLILAGLAYLLLRKVVSFHVPLTYLGTVALLTFLVPAQGFERFDVLYALSHLCSGSLMLASVFMACDPVTTPLTSKGRVLFAAGCGVLTVFIRYFAKTEGALYAILLMNLAVPLIDKITRPKPFGKAKEQSYPSKIK
jgi:electron transport complex protein RnfD